MEIIQSKEKLLEFLGQQEKVVVVEKNAVARIMVRFIKRQGFEQKLLGILAEVSKEKVLLGKPCKSIREAKEEEGVKYIVVELRNNRHEKALSVLEEQGIRNIVLVNYEVFAEISREENPQLDFLCAGFTKCGTTSLSTALNMNKKIKLPKGKETFYLHWRNKYDDSPAKYREKYFAKKPSKGVKLGEIEPSYHVSARDVYECYGKDIKLIFLVRQPVNATFSYYKMLMRRPRRKRYVDYYKKYKKYSVEIFGDFLDDCIFSERVDRFQYDKWISEYLEYFSMDQIKVVVFEELICNTEQVMSEIQDFIGVSEKMVYESLPHSNEGSGVSANYLGAYINYRFYHSIRNRKENKEISKKKQLFYDTAKKLQKYTTVENNDKMKEEHRAVLTEFYKPSVERLEKLLGRSLKDVWGEF